MSPTRSAASEADEGRVGRLIEEAGERPELPTEHLEQIHAAAHATWRETVAERAEDTAPRPTARRSPSLGMALALAAAILLALGVVLWRPLLRSGPAAGELGTVVKLSGSVTVSSPGGLALERGRRVGAGATIETAESSGLALRLDSGESVRLAAASALRLDSARRLELLRGAVYVDSGDGGSGVAIVTALGTATDIGTQFEVRLAEGEVRVRVREGLVRLGPNGEGQTAVAGSELTLRSDGSFSERSIEVSGDEWSWVVEQAPGMESAEPTVHELLDWVGHEMGWEVTYADAESEAIARRRTLSGDLSAPPDEAWRFVAGAGLEARVENGVLVVGRR